MTAISEVEAKCRAAIREAEAAGIRVVPTLSTSVGPDGGEVCLLGAVRGNDRMCGYSWAAAEVLGLSLGQAKDLESGFMDWILGLVGDGDGALYALGQTLRAEQLAKGGV